MMTNDPYVIDHTTAYLRIIIKFLSAVIKITSSLPEG